MKANCDGAVSRQLLTITLMEELWCKGEMAQQIKPSQFVSVSPFLCLLFYYSSLLLYSALSLLQSFLLRYKFYTIYGPLPQAPSLPWVLLSNRACMFTYHAFLQIVV